MKDGLVCMIFLESGTPANVGSHAQTPPERGGSGDLWLISRASLTLITSRESFTSANRIKNLHNKIHHMLTYLDVR